MEVLWEMEAERRRRKALECREERKVAKWRLIRKEGWGNRG